MKLGSLFDGSGTAPLAATMCGIEPVWASEIEPYPIRVTKARFPNMKHLGDITQINGAEIEPVDIICGGSPCQDLSVAGKQTGIHDGERSHLFFEMTRIIKEMRESTNGKYPKYVIWENVPGAFSSNNGNDFLAVLQAFAEIAENDILIPRPATRGKTERLVWTASGEVVGDGWSIAWRTVDAQYWGVPQRRRRIYLVTDFADGRAGEILFERKGRCWYPAESGEAREGTSDNAEGGAGGSCGVRCLNPWDFQAIRQYAVDGVYPAITSNETGGQNRQGVCYALQGNGIGRSDTAGCNGCGWRENECYTLNTIDRPAVVYPETVGALNATDYKGILNQNVLNAVVYDKQRRDKYSASETSSTLTAHLAKEANDIIVNSSGDGICGTIDSHYYKGTGEREGVEREIICMASGQAHAEIGENVAPTLTDDKDRFPTAIPSVNRQRRYIVRRLTPLECCRLQGFPDCWTDGVEGSDSAKYKMWGNGMALPNMLHVMRGIARQPLK